MIALLGAVYAMGALLASAWSLRVTHRQYRTGELVQGVAALVVGVCWPLVLLYSIAQAILTPSEIDE